MAGSSVPAGRGEAFWGVELIVPGSLPSLEMCVPLKHSCKMASVLSPCPIPCVYPVPCRGHCEAHPGSPLHMGIERQILFGEAKAEFYFTQII